MLNFDVDIKILLSTSKNQVDITNLSTPLSVKLKFGEKLVWLWSQWFPCFLFWLTVALFYGGKFGFPIAFVRVIKVRNCKFLLAWHMALSITICNKRPFSFLAHTPNFTPFTGEFSSVCLPKVHMCLKQIRNFERGFANSNFQVCAKLDTRTATYPGKTSNGSSSDILVMPCSCNRIINGNTVIHWTKVFHSGFQREPNKLKNELWGHLWENLIVSTREIRKGDFMAWSN